MIAHFCAIQALPVPNHQAHSYVTISVWVESYEGCWAYYLFEEPGPADGSKPLRITSISRLRYMFVALIAAVALLPIGAASAEGDLPVLEWHSIASEFPEGFQIQARASSEKHDITTIAIRLRIGQEERGVYNYLDRDEEAGTQDGDAFELFWNTNSGQKYIPPGTIIAYNFEVEDSAGNRLETEPQPFIFYDARFVDEQGNSMWEEVSAGTVTVAYKGPVKSRAENILSVINETLEKMRPVMGDAALEEPIRVTMYNNTKEMLEALPPRSASIGRELITEGQAFTNLGTLLVLGGGRLALGTASHEVMHIITHRAGDSIFRRVPAWLDEGLSEYANVNPGYSYDIALEFAVETDRLLPHVYMPALPGHPEDVIIFYGQARSIVRMMIEVFGPEKMNQLMAELKTGTDMDDALTTVYGLDRPALDSAWRRAIGAEVLDRSRVARARPTAAPRVALSIYSLTPQAEAEVVGAQSDPPTPTPTPEPTPVPTPVPEPTQVAKSAPAEEATPVAEQPRETGSSGGGCLAPAPGVPATTELATMGLLVGLAGLAFRRRRK